MSKVVARRCTVNLIEVNRFLTEVLNLGDWDEPHDWT